MLGTVKAAASLREDLERRLAGEVVDNEEHSLFN